MKNKFKNVLAVTKQRLMEAVEYCRTHPIKVIASILLPLLAVGVTIKLVLWIISLLNQAAAAIVAFVNKNLVPLVLVVSGIWWLSHRKGGEKPPAVNPPNEKVVLKHAKQGLDALLDHILLVVESLAEQTEIYSPRTKGELAYPDKKRCIRIEDGVAVVTVRLHYAGELDPVKFLGRFSDRMAQKLNAGELPGHPNPVFYDEDNETHTAIQGIRCIPVKSEKSVLLEVIRVNQAAIALLDKVERERLIEADDEEQLTDDEL